MQSSLSCIRHQGCNKVLDIWSIPWQHQGQLRCDMPSLTLHKLHNLQEAVQKRAVASARHTTELGHGIKYTGQARPLSGCGLQRPGSHDWMLYCLRACFAGTLVMLHKLHMQQAAMFCRMHQTMLNVAHCQYTNLLLNVHFK